MCSFSYPSTWDILSMSFQRQHISIINCAIWMPNVYHTLTHRIDEVGKTPGGHLIQHPCSSRVPQSTLLRIMSRWFLNISREGDPTTSLSNVFQCSVTYTVRFFLMLGWNSPCSSFCPYTVPHSYCWNYWEEPGYILLAPSLQILAYIDKIPSQSSPFQAKKKNKNWILHELAYHIISFMLLSFFPWFIVALSWKIRWLQSPHSHHFGGEVPCLFIFSVTWQ